MSNWEKKECMYSKSLTIIYNIKCKEVVRLFMVSFKHVDQIKQ